MMQLARNRVGKKVVGKYYVCVRRFASTQHAATRQSSEEFETVEQMLRPAPRKGDSPLWAHHNKNFRTSRYPTYDFDFSFKNNSPEVAGDGVPERFENSWTYRLTIMRGNAESRADTGKKLLADAQELIKKGTPPDAKWLDKAMYETGTAEQVDELYNIAEELGAVDNKLISTYIYNMARRAGFEKAIEKYESVKQAGKADDDIHASGIAAYAKAMQGEKALEIYEKLQKELGPKVPSRVHSSMMTYYFDFGEMRKGFEVYNNLEKNGGIIDTRILTSLIRGHRLAGNLKAAQAAFDSIAKRELLANINAHCELVMAYAKPGNNVGEMMAKLQQMKNVGYRPPHTLYSNVIRCMLEKEEYNNALMALDMQFKEKSYPLDKRLVIRIARHFAKIEKGERIKAKTEYAIWIGRKAGLYTDDLFYLTTPHFDLMDEYYFRHHPEYDFPNELRKPYQFKSWDEYPVFHAEDLRNEFERRTHAGLAAQQPPQEKRMWSAELPSFSRDHNVRTMRPVALRWNIEPAEEILGKYDEILDLMWGELVSMCEAIVKEGIDEDRQFEELEAKFERRRREVEEYRKAKEEKEKLEEQAKAKEADEAKMKPDTQTDETEKTENTEAKEKEVVEAKEKEVVEAKEPETKEEATAKEKEPTTTEEHEKKETSGESKEPSETKEVGEQAKITEPTETKAKEEEEKKPFNAETMQKQAKEEKEKEEGKEEPQLREKRRAHRKSSKEREEQLKFLLDIARKCKKYDDILPAGMAVDPALRAELVQQWRFTCMKDSLTDFRHLPAFIMPQQFDTLRLRMLAAACDDALAELRKEVDMRKPVDLELRIMRVESYKRQVLDLLSRKKYEVAQPLGFKPVPNLEYFMDKKLQENTTKLQGESPAQSEVAQEDPFTEMTHDARVFLGVATPEYFKTYANNFAGGMVLEGEEEEEEAKIVAPEVELKILEEEPKAKKSGLFTDVSKFLEGDR